MISIETSLKLKTGELDYHLYSATLNPHVIVVNPVMHTISVVTWPCQYWLVVSSHVAYFLNKVAWLNIDHTEANLIEQGFNIFGHGQPDQIVNYVSANLLATHPALIHMIAQREKMCHTT